MSRQNVVLGAAVGFWGILAALVASGGAVAQGAAQSTAQGARVFAAKCQICHSVERAKGATLAPNLAGVMGRKAGTLPRFSYSPAMVRSNIVWDSANLDAFLAAPQRVVRGNRMAFAGVPNAKERIDLIAFLKSKK
ncbi:MAG: c-type cytochrome [Myxococcota bacterium]